MKEKAIRGLVAVTLAFFVAVVAGCGGGGGAGLPPGAVQMDAITTASSGNIQAKIGGVTVANKLVVTFALSDEQGLPLDPTVLLKTSTNRIRFYVAQLDATGNYKNYILTASPATGLPTYDGYSAKAINNPKGTFATVKPGVYTYTFGADIKGNTLFDATKTQTVAMQILRNTTRNGKPFQQMSDPYFSFVPAGGTPGHREVVAVSACNQCHGKLIAHGSRIEIALCILCHNPNANLLSTGQAIDFKAMIHKIHMGGNLPSKAYFMNPTFDNFSTVGYPLFSNDSAVTGTPVDCVKCHQAGTDTFGNAYGADVTKWQEAPTRANCTTCHNTTSFDGSTSGTVDGVAGVAMTPHTGGTQTSDTGCSTCHPSIGTAYDTSVSGAHAVFETVNANNAPVMKILNATNVGPGQSPTVTFQITDGSGNPISPSATTNTPSIALAVAAKPLGMPDFVNTTTSLNTLPAGYSYGFNNNGAGYTITVSSSGSTTSVAAIGKLGAVDASRGIYFVNFSSASTTTKYVLPTLQGDYANGATIAFALQARRTDLTATHYGAAKSVRLPGQVFPAYYDLASGSPSLDIRRKVVDTNACNGCHKNLVDSIHGGGRPNVEYCVMCHTPNLGNGTVAGDFKVFIHKFHTGVDLSDQTYNFNGVSGSSIRYPNDRRRCNACHIADNPSVTTPTSLSKVGEAPNPVSYLPPFAAVCTSCHDSTTGTFAGASGGAVGHAAAYYTINSVTTPQSFTELCINCHFDSVRALDHQLPN